MTPSNGMLARLYRTGGFADISIGTETKTFQVHKSIVCTQSSFFAAALTGKSQEAEARHIDVEEPEAIIDNLLHHMYELEVPLLGTELLIRIQRTVWEIPMESMEGRVRALLQLQAAADKYGVVGLTELCSAAIMPWLFPWPRSATLTKLGVLLWSDNRPINHAARDKVVDLTARNAAVVRDDEAWTTLHSNSQYCKEVLKYAMKEHRAGGNL
ncbi:hypothetical protein LTR36_003696 [Oleoguttula mirabilis]|uniref:BTB domain-containing protein n=1 Tax=Oleoguttula mirabilis TaxID=1507867 RepID=A0AAV9JIU5_9PEZI|nr:hypothetical protein LTR36_003696 [Oleoguttula mirabilis]